MIKKIKKNKSNKFFLILKQFFLALKLLTFFDFSRETENFGSLAIIAQKFNSL